MSWAAPEFRLPPLTFKVELFPAKVIPPVVTVPPVIFRIPVPTLPVPSDMPVPPVFRIPDPLTLMVSVWPVVWPSVKEPAVSFVRLPVMFRVELELKETELLVVREPESVIVPPLTVVVPFQEFAPPERMSVPFPDLVRL